MWNVDANRSARTAVQSQTAVLSDPNKSLVVGERGWQDQQPEKTADWYREPFHGVACSEPVKTTG
jgi:hypothetical protein